MNVKITEVENFIKDYVNGIEEYLWESNMYINYTDEALADYLDVEIDDISDDLLEEVIKKTISVLKEKGYDAYKGSYNEIKVEKNNL